MILDDEHEFQKHLKEVYQLKNVVRYNTRNVLKKENVAEHSFYVALFALKICKDMNVNEEMTNKAIIKALLHDMPEIELNDITHDVKEKLHLRLLLKSYEDDYFIKHYPEFSDLMNEQDSKVDSIVLLADTMSVYQYCLNELSLGNKSDDIAEIFQESKARLKKCCRYLKDAFEEGGKQ